MIASMLPSIKLEVDFHIIPYYSLLSQAFKGANFYQIFLFDYIHSIYVESRLFNLSNLLPIFLDIAELS